MKRLLILLSLFIVAPRLHADSLGVNLQIGGDNNPPPAPPRDDDHHEHHDHHWREERYERAKHEYERDMRELGPDDPITRESRRRMRAAYRDLHDDDRR
jgi:hypothetical protein